MNTNQVLRGLSTVVLIAVAAFAVPFLNAGENEESDLTLLLKQRVEVLQKLLEHTNMKYTSGLADAGELTAASNQLLFARLDLTSNGPERIKILEEAIANMKRTEAVMKSRYEQGACDYKSYLEYQAERLAIEIKLCREIGTN